MHSTFILDLPQESLATIFGFYAESLYLPVWAMKMHDVMELITISHVCRAFRTVALNCSEFWCTIFLHKPEVVKHLLCHSRGRPLRVCLSEHVPYYSERWSYMQEALPFHHERIKELKLYLPLEDTRTILSKTWKTLPLLSSISLSNPEPSPRGGDIIELDMIPLPSLKVVTLSSAVIRFPWSMCRDLTSLSLDSLMHANIPYFRLSTLSEILSNSPRLRILQVHAMSFQRTNSAIKRIEFEPGAFFAFYTLKNPDVLALVDIISNVALHNLSFDMISQISHDECARLRELVCRLGSHSEGHFWLHLVDARSYVANLLSFLWDPTRAELHVSKSAQPSHSTHLLRNWFSGPASPLSFVEHLHLHFHDMSIHYYMEEESWDDIFGGFPSVVDLSITGCKIHGIPALRALSLPARAETHSGLARPLFFPRLQTIEINPYLQPAVEVDLDVESEDEVMDDMDMPAPPDEDHVSGIDFERDEDHVSRIDSEGHEASWIDSEGHEVSWIDSEGHEASWIDSEGHEVSWIGSGGHEASWIDSEGDEDHVSWIDSEGDESDESEPDPGDEVEPFVCGLLACLSARAELGAKLKTVKWITNGPVLNPRMFEGLVEELFIDGELIELEN